MGAKRYVSVNHPDDWNGLENSFDFILSTISDSYDRSQYLKMLRLGGKFAIAGLSPFAKMPRLSLEKLLWQGGRQVLGSQQISGIEEAQEMLDYSVANSISPEVEVIPADGKAIDKAYQNVLHGKVKLRYVIDMKTLEMKKEVPASQP